MDAIDYKEVLNGLIQRKSELDTELNLVNVAIAAFSSAVHANGSSSKVSVSAPTHSEPITNKKVSLMTWKERVEFALNKLGKATVTEMVEFLKTHLPGVEDDAIKRRVTVMASDMNTYYKSVNTERLPPPSRAFVYSMKKE